MKTATIIQVVIFIFTIIGFSVYYYLHRGRKIKIIMEKYINQKRIYFGEITGLAKKRFPESQDEQLFIPTSPKIWTPLPGSEFFSTTKKGMLCLKAVIDSDDNVYWVKPDNTKYEEKTVEYQEPVLDENGQQTYITAYEKDEDGELILEPYIINGVHQKDENNEPIWQPKTVRKLNTVLKSRIETIPAFYERAIETDVKLYFLNKKLELREKFKKDDKWEKIKQIAIFSILAIVVLGVVYLSYKQVNETVLQERESRESFLVRWSNMMVDMESKKNNNDPNNPEYGKQVIT